MESQQSIIKDLEYLEKELETHKKYTTFLKNKIEQERSKLVILCGGKGHDLEKHESSDYYHTYLYNVCKICNFTTHGRREA